FCTAAWPGRQMETAGSFDGDEPRLRSCDRRRCNDGARGNRPVRSPDVTARLKVRVIPNAKSSEFSSVRNEEWLLRLTAPPIDGKANKAAVEFVAKFLAVPRSAVTLVSGEKSRHKIFEIIGLDVGDIERKLTLSSR